MPGGRCTRKRLWRWRNNPLRRRADIVEAWIVLAVWTVVAVGGAAVGLLTSRAAGEVFADQRAQRRSVRAVLLDDVPGGAPTAGGTTGHRMASVRWTAPDASIRTGRTLVPDSLDAGSTVTVWQDVGGRLTPEPPSSTEAAIESDILGTTAAAALAGLAFGAGGLARLRLDRRRVDAWGREWDQTGPRWGHRTG
ncbi:hypothetical protein ABZT03_08715 [Streptomyces sp. NPDC005574]|uniref:Rv1733c family protein n=1 Tax=Streptomyces sp. NPDC005574 TaxID=3156891 RepID=UPI0033BC2A1F